MLFNPISSLYLHWHRSLLPVGRADTACLGNWDIKHNRKMKRVKKRDTVPPVTSFFFKLCSFFLYLVSLPPGPNLQFWYRAVARRWFCGLAAQTLGYSTSPSSELKAVTQNKTFKKLRNYTAGQRWNIITLPNANTFSGMPDRCSEDRRRLSLTLFITRLSDGYFCLLWKQVVWKQRVAGKSSDIPLIAHFWNVQIPVKSWLLFSSDTYASTSQEK